MRIHVLIKDGFFSPPELSMGIKFYFRNNYKKYRRSFTQAINNSGTRTRRSTIDANHTLLTQRITDK
jgi:hypothetical protein